MCDDDDDATRCGLTSGITSVRFHRGCAVLNSHARMCEVVEDVAGSSHTPAQKPPLKWGRDAKLGSGIGSFSMELCDRQLRLLEVVHKCREQAHCSCAADLHVCIWSFAICNSLWVPIVLALYVATACYGGGLHVSINQWDCCHAKITQHSESHSECDCTCDHSRHSIDEFGHVLSRVS